MMKQLLLFMVITLLLSVGLIAAGQSESESSEKYTPVSKYDPERDAEADIKNALLEAQRTGKRVLVEVGGTWCIWCTILDNFFEQNPKLVELRDQSYIMVKVNYSKDNKNENALSHYPEISGFPHIFVLDAKGNLLHSQNTGDLEAGRTYDEDKVYAFLKKWAPME